MKTYRMSTGPDGRPRVAVPYRGTALLGEPMYNKSSAFTLAERQLFGLEGLLPSVVSPMKLQAERVYQNIVRKSEPLERYVGLAALQDRNETLYYRVLRDHLEELLPIVYTPTVGQASKQFSHIFRRGRGIWISPDHRGRVAQVLENAPFDGVRLVVATDNQAILGIGDQGAGGMVIPIGKLAIYCAAAGIHPSQTLPISLDVGTNNEDLLTDELYLGWRHPRLTGEPYFELIEEFVTALKQLFPDALLQWEDFQKSNAFELLDRYRDRILSFNDDIQGTGATALAGLLAATKISGVPLSEQRVVIVGGGAAGMGIAHQLRIALAAEGMEGENLTRAVAVLDSRGLIVDDRQRLDNYKRRFAWSREMAESAGLAGERALADVVDKVQPTALIGTSGQAGLFSEKIVRAMAAQVDRPVIFPFSNPTALAEARPQDLYRWTDGRSLVATGSPFAPVDWRGRKHRIGQGNNAFVFPGVGLGALIGESDSISDEMFTAAASALAGSVTADDLEHGQLYPAIERLRDVTRRIALEVAARASSSDAPSRDLERRLADAMWSPDYPELDAV